LTAIGKLYHTREISDVLQARDQERRLQNSIYDASSRFDRDIPETLFKKIKDGLDR
jgi:hypothetical protein